MFSLVLFFLLGCFCACFSMHPVSSWFSVCTYLIQIWEHWTRDKAIDLIDASLNSNYPVDNVLKCIHIGLLCVQQKPTDRPLMSAVNYMLNSNTDCLPPLSRPTIWFRETDELNPKASISWGTTETKSSQNEVSITEMESRWALRIETSYFSSSEYIFYYISSDLTRLPIFFHY
jgi:hypothetical protein